RDHRAARHRPDAARAAAGALRLGAAALRGGDREDRPQDQPVPSGRHAGARFSLDFLQGISRRLRHPPGIAGQDQAPPDRLVRIHLDHRRQGVRRSAPLARHSRRQRRGRSAIAAPGRLA
ncbi:hypothetical protein LTR94_030184, partial [Friedmanniomyces endolithicus]